MNSMAVVLQEWLDLMDREYLQDFVDAGGSAVKFVVANEPGSAMVLAESKRIASSHDMHYVTIDSAAVKLHLIHDIFFALSQQIDWQADAQRFVEGLFRCKAYQWPVPGKPVALADVAIQNQIDAAILNLEFNQWLTAKLMKDPEIAQDFRIAVMRLCLNCLIITDGLGDDETPILQWLRGELKGIGALKAAQIYSKINRHNARPMLRSLCRWLRLVGYPGLFLTIDLRQVTKANILGITNFKYTAAAVMDTYEVLRQLIDDIDLFEGLFVVVCADPAFIGEDQKRSVAANMALKMRVWRDVQAKDRDNPLAPLVFLETAAHDHGTSGLFP